MADMKPCPFCGSPWVQVRWTGFRNAKPSGFTPGLYAECTDCFALKGPYSEKEDAEYAWNRRADNVRPVKIGHYITDDMGDSSCSECGEKYLDITKRFCPECGAELRRNDGDQ